MHETQRPAHAFRPDRRLYGCRLDFGPKVGRHFGTQRDEREARPFPRLHDRSLLFHHVRHSKRPVAGRRDGSYTQFARVDRGCLRPVRTNFRFKGTIFLKRFADHGEDGNVQNDI